MNALAGAELAAAADENFRVHASWVTGKLPGTRVLDEPDLVLVDSGLPCDTFNFVLRARIAEDRVRERVSDALAFFARTGHPFSWWVGPADRPRNLGEFLITAGLNEAETELAMAADLTGLPVKQELPAGLEIRRVRTCEDVQAFAEINAANWTPPDARVIRFYDRATSVLLESSCPLRLYLGFLAGEPVATAELTVAGGVGGLYNICTRARFRRRGIGSAMTLQPLLDARKDGISRAVLQAAAEGVGVYERVGFSIFGQITEYQPGGGSDG